MRVRKCLCCPNRSSNISARGWCTECEQEFMTVHERVKDKLGCMNCPTPYACLSQSRCLATKPKIIESSPLQFSLI